MCKIFPIDYNYDEFGNSNMISHSKMSLIDDWFSSFKKKTTNKQVIYLSVLS